MTTFSTEQPACHGADATTDDVFAEITRSATAAISALAADVATLGFELSQHIAESCRASQP